jgi:TonB family protein
MLTGVLAAMMLQGAGAVAPPAPGLIVRPDWQRIPNAQDIAKYYPKAALKEDLAGRAVLACRVTAEGRLTACTAENVDPEGAGFGEAALAMSAVFKMRPQTRDGTPAAGGAVRIPLVFIMPANLRAAPVRAHFPEVTGEVVELDCRFTGPHLDNCFARGGSKPKAAEVALEAAKGVTLPPLPTKRTQGRIVLPLVFVDGAGEMTAPDMVTRPFWRQRPSAMDVHRVYPQAAKKGEAPVGNVEVECRFTGAGGLSDCGVASESPEGLGFGAAALSLMEMFKAESVDAFGLKVEERKIRVPIRISPTPPPARGTGR